MLHFFFYKVEPSVGNSKLYFKISNGDMTECANFVEYFAAGKKIKIDLYAQRGNTDTAFTLCIGSVLSASCVLTHFILQQA